MFTPTSDTTGVTTTKKGNKEKRQNVIDTAILSEDNVKAETMFPIEILKTKYF